MKSRYTDTECPIAQALDQVGDWWTLLIVREAIYGTRRFDEFQKALGIARNVLSDRMKWLVANDLLEKSPDPEDGRAFVYCLTPKGRSLWPVIVSLLLWSNRWIAGDGNEALNLVHGEDDLRVLQLAAIDEAGTQVAMQSTRLEPGPTASDEMRERMARMTKLNEQ